MNCINCSILLKFNQKKYCSISCQQHYKYKLYIQTWKAGKLPGGNIWGISDYVKRYLREKYNNKCARCNWNEINPYTNLVPLEVEHLDGNWENSKEENLILICPNCHSLTSTFRSLNKGKGRHSVLKTKRKACYSY